MELQRKYTASEIFSIILWSNWPTEWIPWAAELRHEQPGVSKECLQAKRADKCPDQWLRQSEDTVFSSTEYIYLHGKALSLVCPGEMYVFLFAKGVLYNIL